LDQNAAVFGQSSNYTYRFIIRNAGLVSIGSHGITPAVYQIMKLIIKYMYYSIDLKNCSEKYLIAAKWDI